MRDLLTRHLKNEYALDPMENLISPEMISPYVVELPKSVLTQVQSFIKATFALRTSEAYKKYYKSELKQRGLIDPGNFSICMSYDFHLDQDLTPRLIEINTNAAFLALGYELYKARQLNLPIETFKIDDLKTCVENECALNGQSLKSGSEVQIIDENPEQQRLYAEFLLYQKLFDRWGYNCKIRDYRETASVPFTYNRFTDFLMEKGESQSLKKKFVDKQTCFSPNPNEYLLLADKQRLIEWSDDEFWLKMNLTDLSVKENIQEYILRSVSVSTKNIEELWSDRKKLFFKPKRAYGSKQSYKGASMSRKVLADVMEGDFIAQEYVQAPEINFSSTEASKALLGHDQPQIFKYDLRFYTYKDELQMVIARLYQGQVTNAKTLGGGFAPVIFK
jgi:hypothetical protein